jgi:excisionase family DNA binding protein
MQRLLNISEAAEFLGISKTTLRGWSSKRKIPFVKVGRRVLFNAADLIRFVQANTVAARPQRVMG